MQKIRHWIAVAVLGLGAAQAQAATAWSTQDYDLYPGDFNGDGLTDLLYISRDGRHANGIVLSDGTGLNVPLQSWGNAYLGIPWSDGTYNIIVADFDGDGKADILLQPKAPGDAYLLLTEDGGVGAISQTIPNTAAGIVWSANQHVIIAGDFNGDGKADLFFQATDPKGLNAVIYANQNGVFTAAQPTQSWTDGYLGLNWASSEARVYAADFNGDKSTDLLVQAQPVQATIGGLPQPASYPPNMNGVVLGRANAKPFILEGLQAWSRDGFGADWSPLNSSIVTGDFNADGRADVILQGLTPSNPSYLLAGNAPGAIFVNASTLPAKSMPTADGVRLLPGQYTAGQGQGLYLQATSRDGSNALGSLAGKKLSVTAAELPGAAVSSSSSAMALSAAAPSVGAPAALLTVTSAGRTAGQFAVSAMGAATYQIPIWTPPGARGIEPKLALVYASGSPDGVMGPGWSLSGLSSITRCNKTYADNNGSPAPVYLGTTDDFCLDGNRLRVTTSVTTKCNAGATGTVYYTEIANFSRVTACGTAGSGPSYFVVEGKDALIYEYGNTADSKAYASGGSTPYAWMLNKVRDRESSADNMIVTYSTTSGAVQPSNIQYTQTPSTNGATYPYTVAFTYQNRVTNLDRFVAGGEVQQTQVLAKINIQSSGTSVRQYNLTYATAPTTQRDRLSSVQECGGLLGTDCLRATAVTYQDGVSGIASPTTATGSGATSAGSLLSADLNGDGRDDLIYSVLSGSTGQVWAQLATSGGFSAPINTGVTMPPTTGMLVDDFLGVGRDCILGANGSAWSAYCWNPSTGSFTSASTGLTTATTNCVTADYYGRGRPDVICFGTPTGSNPYNPTYVPIILYPNTSTGSAVSFSSTGTTISSISYNINAQIQYALYGNNQFRSSGVRRMDFNGDGADDLLVYESIVIPYPYQSYTYLASVSSSSSTVYLSGSFLQGGFVPVSWNDDGCTDLAVQSYIRVSQCNGSVATGFSLPATPALFLDWNGDGRMDALANVGGVWTVYRSLGTAAAAGVSTGIAASSGTWIPLDQNGDGESDLAFADASAGNAIKYGLHNGAATPPDLATSISDGWGVTAVPSYVPITQSNYTAGTGTVFPEQDFQGAAYVVSQAVQSDGIGGNYTTSYWYFGARVNRQGRGFEGFEKTQAQDSRNGLYHLVNYNQTFAFTGLVSLDRVYQSNGTSLISQTSNGFLVITVNDLTDTSGAKCKLNALAVDTRCFPYLNQVTSIQNEITTGVQVQSTSATYQVDPWGNQTTATTTTTDTDSSSPEYNKSWTSTIAKETLNYR